MLCCKEAHIGTYFGILDFIQPILWVNCVYVNILTKYKYNNENSYLFLNDYCTIDHSGYKSSFASTVLYLKEVWWKYGILSYMS